MTTETIIYLLIIGAVAGLLSGMLGVGGGIIVIPALIFVMGMSQYQAQGISLALLSIPVAIGGAVNYYKQGHVEIKYVLVLAVTFLIGGYIGSLISMRISGDVLRKIFAVFMIIAAVKILMSK